jgi:hypothetical protein
MEAVDTKITKWFLEVSFPNPKRQVFRPLCEITHEGHLRIGNEDYMNDEYWESEVMFFDTYIQAEDFARNLNSEFGYFVRVMEYVT